MRKSIIMGNWKMNGSLAMASSLAGDIAKAIPGHVEVAVFPAFVYLSEVKQALHESLVGLGGQDLSLYEAGAYTAEISGSMLKNTGAEYVLIGHSERRQYHNETSQAVADKVKQALKHALIPVVCIGETLEERESGNMVSVLKAQMHPVLEALSDGELSQCVIAYEPVWAIGTGVTASPEQAQDAHVMIREMIANSSPEVANKIRIVYGGSVKPSNAQELLGLPDIDGALVGGASLKAEDFLAICQAV